MYNHRYFYELLEKKEYDDYSLIFIDIDSFKLFNDTMGHTVGDEVLRLLANVIRKIVKDNGKVFRYGGEEFTVILNNCNKYKAYSISEEIRTKIIENNKLQSYGNGLKVTVSIGVASFNEDSTDYKEVIKYADLAMYYSKSHGKNMTTIYKTDLHQ